MIPERGTTPAAPRGTPLTWPAVKPGSGNARVLDLLADRRWHSTYELQVGLKVMAHSRLAELRDRGYRFDKRQIPGATGLRMFEWRLIGTPLDESERPPLSLSSRGTAPSKTQDGESPAGAAPAPPPVPLTLFEAHR